MRNGNYKRDKDGNWFISYKRLNPHAGVSKLGTGPGVSRPVYEDIEYPIHPSCVLVMHKSYEGKEVNFRTKVDCLEECYGKCGECNSLKEYAIVINQEEEKKNDEWDAIENEFLNSPGRFGRSTFAWLKENFEIPTRKNI